ncbi:MAG: nuclear transport factor 2 family protein [Gemmatimonadaceae bacterium]
MTVYRLLVALALVSGIHDTGRAQGSGRRAREVLRLHLEKFQWLIAKDSARVDRLLTDDARFIHSNGVVETKRDVLDDFRTKRIEYFNVSVRDSSVRVYDERMAVVTGKMKVAGALDGKPYETDLLYTEVYVLRNDRWRLVTRHASRLP